MSRFVFDIETDDLLLECTKCHIIAAYNIDTQEMKYWLEGDLSWMKVFDEATLLIGHNILGFDIFALEKLFKWKPNKDTNFHDTLIMSQVLDYKRFPDGRHSLEAWGEFLGNPKIVFDDFSMFTQEMLTYCLQDVNLNVEVYARLLSELRTNSEGRPNLKPYLKAEHYVSRWCSKAQLEGWPFHVTEAKALFEKMEVELNEVRDKLLPLLGMKTVATDKKLGVVLPKLPKWVKNGCYDAHTARWFEITPEEGLFDEPLIDGPYSRVEFVPLDLDSVQDVKVFLFRNDWQPTEWNYKTEVDEEGSITKTKTSPKITEDSLEFLGGDGKLYCDFLTTKSRHSILNTWLKNVDSNGNLHGDCFTIGTPSMRARHSIIVNVPAADSAWGKEMRQLFGVKPGWKFIGADSSGNQARGLAHYLKDEAFIKTLLEGDVHQYNADILTEALAEMKITHIVPRGVAKRILYAFLFGAAGAKLWGYIFGVQEAKKGTTLKNKFIKAVPGFKVLLEKLDTAYSITKKHGDGFVRGIGGNKIYVDSYHKLLVYLLQACEKVTCSAACMLLMQGLEEENIPYQPLIFMHDELDFMVPEEYSERASIIAKKAFKDGPAIFGVTIMDGESKTGNNWYECH